MIRVKVIGDMFHGQVPAGSVYIGRSSPGLSESPFANPHKIGKPCRLCAGAEHSRPAAVVAYRRHLEEHPELVEQARVKLAGKDIACWCHPTEACHGDVLLELLNNKEGLEAKRAFAQQLVDEKVASGELIRVEGGGIVEAAKFDPTVHTRRVEK